MEIFWTELYLTYRIVCTFNNERWYFLFHIYNSKVSKKFYSSSRNGLVTKFELEKFIFLKVSKNHFNILNSNFIFNIHQNFINLIPLISGYELGHTWVFSWIVIDQIKLGWAKSNKSDGVRCEKIRLKRNFCRVR